MLICYVRMFMLLFSLAVMLLVCNVIGIGIRGPRGPDPLTLSE